MKVHVHRYADKYGNSFIPAAEPIFADVEEAFDYGQDNALRFAAFGVRWEGSTTFDQVEGQIVTPVVAGTVTGVGEVWFLAGPRFDDGPVLDGMTL